MAEVNKYLTILESAWQEHLAEREPNAPTVISTFAGCGGSSLGYSMAGFRELLANEWDDNAVQTFKLNFPDVPVIQGDIAKLTVEQVLELTGLQPGELDVFDGSPPCQGFSTAGKRVMDDPRNQLFREYIRLLRGLQPKVFVMENVSGMVKGKMKLIFADILRELKSSGYKVSVRLLNAMYFNVPQSRQRLIFIGVREDLGIEPSHPKAESKPFTAKEAFREPVDIPDWQMIVANNTKNYAVGKELVNLRAGENNFNLARIDPNKPSPTICKRGGNHVRCLSHWSELRVMTPAELSRLASYPNEFQWFKSGRHDSAAFENIWARIGNSVPPLFMRSIARHIRQEILGS